MAMIELLTHVARGGGGGSSGGGGGAGIIVLPIIIISAVVSWWRRKQQIKKAQQALSAAEAGDPVWDSAVARAKEVFPQFQQDWSDFNVAGMKKYVTPGYLEHLSLMLEALKQLNRQNRMSNVMLTSAIIFNVSDSTKNDSDNFDVEIKGSAHDELVDNTTGDVLFTDDNPFTEVWNFDRQGKEWMLDHIAQVDAESAIEKGYTSRDDATVKADQETQMRDFAKRNNLFYNADFGWLLMPTQGQLFTLANFGRSDINYHVIGKFHGTLVQFYQYIPIIQDKRQMGDYFKAWYNPAKRYDAYIVAQAVLPKHYGDIVVTRRTMTNGLYVPSGMTKIQMEGVDFNKDYWVFASDAEKVTSFELLDPAFMARLIDLPFTINIEVVDNILYLYSTDKTAEFDTMLGLLETAFQTIKM